MASRHDYAVGTDDVGTVAAVDIEVSTALHLFAAVPPRDPAVAEEVLLGLEPTQALALCESSSFYQEICDSDGFKDRYRFEWHVRVHLANLGGDRIDVSLFRTRVVGDIKEIYERSTRLARTEYTFFKRMNLDRTLQRLQLEVPTAQSSLGGMATPSCFDENRLSVRFDVVQDDQTVVPLRDRTLTHWFANGETIVLSE